MGAGRSAGAENSRELDDAAGVRAVETLFDCLDEFHRAAQASRHGADRRRIPESGAKPVLARLWRLVSDHHVVAAKRDVPTTAQTPVEGHDGPR